MIPDGTEIVRVKSENALCTNFVDLDMASTTTTTSTSSTTTTTTTSNLGEIGFDWTAVTGNTVTAININGITPTLIAGSDVPFSSDNHIYSTTQVGISEVVNISASQVGITGSITLIDSASVVHCQNTAIGSFIYSFPGVVIDNITTVQVIATDSPC